MTEAEVSLRVALFFIKNEYTSSEVSVSIDGAQIKTGDQVHFDIISFLKDNGFVGDFSKWSGDFMIKDHSNLIHIGSTPGIGDVGLVLSNGRTLYVESKKGKKNKSSQEYTLMREAIGQVMTSEALEKGAIPAVAVPFSEKSYELATRWSKLSAIDQIGIRFLLVKEDGDVVIVGKDNLKWTSDMAEIMNQNMGMEKP